MPSGETRSISTGPLPSHGLGLTLLRRRGFEFHLGFGVIVLSVVLLAVALIGTATQGSGALVWVILTATVFWLSGWMVQILTYLCSCQVAGSSPRRLMLGVFGVELEPHRWHPLGALLVLIATILSVVLLGALYQYVHQAGIDPNLIRREPTTWSFPSLGFGRYDSPWRAAAWLCWAQAVFQLIPFPRSPGRHALGAVTSLAFSRLDAARQRIIFRRLVNVSAFLFVGVTLWSYVASRSLGGVQEIVLLGIAMTLWSTSSGNELLLILEGYRAAMSPEQQPTANAIEGRFRSSWDALFRNVRTWIAYRKIRKAHQQEIDEAIDANRLDEILARLHQEGIDALSEDDRQVLRRVSENLRRQRHEEAHEQ